LRSPTFNTAKFLSWRAMRNIIRFVSVSSFLHFHEKGATRFSL
jgi:hypothetical protein